MRKISLLSALLFMMLGFSSLHAEDLITLGMVKTLPANNSSVTSLDLIEIEVDMSTVIAKYGSEAPYGIYLSVSPTQPKYQPTLYEGDKDTGTKIGVIVTKGTSQDNKYQLDFSGQNISVKPNQLYTLYIPYSAFWVYDTRYAVTNSINKTIQKETYCPEITVTFTGAELAGEIALESYTPTIENALEVFPKLSMEFSYNIGSTACEPTLKEGAKADLYEGDNLVKSVDLTLSETEPKMVEADFGNEALYYGHTYKVNIPAGSVFPVNPANKEILTDRGNKEIILKDYKGATIKYDLLPGRISPSNNSELSYFTEVKIPFKFEEGYGVAGNAGLTADFYLGSGDDKTLIKSYECRVSTDMNTVIVPLWYLTPEAGSVYTLVFKKGQIIPTKADNTSTPEIRNAEVTLTYTTPAQLVPVKKLVISTVNPQDNAQVEKLETLKITFDKYILDNNEYALAIVDAEKAAVLYEVAADGTETELLQAKFTLISGGGGYEAPFNRTLHTGKTYKVRIPAGYFAPGGNENLTREAANVETEYTFIGAGDPYHLTAEKASIPEGSGLTNLGVAAFYFKEPVTPVKDMKAILYKEEEVVKEVLLNVAQVAGADYTMVCADFCDPAAEFKPYEIEAGKDYKLELPQGALASTSDGGAWSGHASVSFKGTAAAAEYVNVNYVLGDNAASASKTVKGQTMSFTITPEENWEVESILFNGEEVKSELSVYTTPALEADAQIKIELAYTGFVYEEKPDGIVEVSGTSLKAYSRDGHIFITGITIGNKVIVYSMGGSVLGEYVAAKEYVDITLPVNATYLVRVADKVMKVYNQDKTN